MRVFDSSAVLALIFGETGADLAARRMDEHDALISSVKNAEVPSKLFDGGLSFDDVAATSRQLPLKLSAPAAAHQLGQAAVLTSPSPLLKIAAAADLRGLPANGPAAPLCYARSA